MLQFVIFIFLFLFCIVFCLCFLGSFFLVCAFILTPVIFIWKVFVKTTQNSACFLNFCFSFCHFRFCFCPLWYFFLFYIAFCLCFLGSFVSRLCICSYSCDFNVCFLVCLYNCFFCFFVFFASLINLLINFYRLWSLPGCEASQAAKPFFYSWARTCFVNKQ